jgi:hypothetical protein
MDQPDSLGKYSYLNLNIIDDKNIICLAQDSLSDTTNWTADPSTWHPMKRKSYLIKTDLDGKSWYLSENNLSSISQPIGIYFISPDIGWCIGMDNIRYDITLSNFLYKCLIYKTTDAGKNWVKQLDTLSPKLKGYLNNILFKDKNNGIVIGPSSMLYETTDAGQHWIDRIPYVPLYNINESWSVTYIQNNIYISTYDGYVLKYDPSFVGVENIFVDNSNKINTYPLPFVTNITISADLTPSAYQITIYDLYGSKIATLYDGFHSGGELKLNWDSQGAPSGMYNVIIKSEKEAISKKIILSK